MPMKLTVVFLVLLIAAHAIDAAGVRMPTPIPVSEVNANEQKIARQCVSLADALTSCFSLLTTSKTWKELPHSPLAMAKSYFMAITQLVDQLLETIDTIVPHMDYKMRQALNIDRFLFEIARMAYLLATGVYYAPLEAIRLSDSGDDSVPSDSQSAQLHAYLYYVTHTACISFGAMAPIHATLKTFSRAQLFTRSDLRRFQPMINFYNAYAGDQNGDCELSVAHYLELAGEYAGLFMYGDVHDGDDELERRGRELRQACARMGGPKKKQEQRANGVVQAMFIVENLSDMFDT